MDGTRTTSSITEARAHAQVLAEEVRTYLLHHGGALDAHDEASLDAFAEKYLMPTLGAVWEHGHGAAPASAPASVPESTARPVNPYAPVTDARGACRGLWWHRLLLHPDDVDRPDRWRRARASAPTPPSPRISRLWALVRR